MILTLLFLALLRLAWLMRQQIYDFFNSWSSKVTGKDVSTDNHIILYEDINFNSIDPLYLKPGDEINIYEREQKDKNLPGARRDHWYYKSMKFEGNVEYQLIIYNDNEKQIIPLIDTKHSEVHHIMDWLQTLPLFAREKIDNVQRNAMSIKVVSNSTEMSGTGVTNIPAILYKGYNYENDYLSNEFKQYLDKGEPVEICVIKSVYEKLPSGVYLETTTDQTEVQRTKWLYKSLKVNPGTKIRLTIKEESVYTQYDDVSMDFTLTSNIPNLEVWLELMDWNKTKYRHPQHMKNRNERRYLLEMI